MTHPTIKSSRGLKSALTSCDLPFVNGVDPRPPRDKFVAPFLYLLFVALVHEVVLFYLESLLPGNQFLLFGSFPFTLYQTSLARSCCCVLFDTKEIAHYQMMSGITCFFPEP